MQRALVFSRSFVWVVLVFFGVGLWPEALAQDYNWNGAVTSGAFNNPANWQPNGAPVYDDAIYFEDLEDPTSVLFSADEAVGFLGVSNSQVTFSSQEGEGFWGLYTDEAYVGNPELEGADQASLTIQSGWFDAWNMTIVSGANDTRDDAPAPGFFVGADGEVYAGQMRIGLGYYGGEEREVTRLSGQWTIDGGYAEIYSEEDRYIGIGDLAIGAATIEETIGFLEDEEDEPLGGIGAVTVLGSDNGEEPPRDWDWEDWPNLYVNGSVSVGTFGGTGELTVTDNGYVVIEAANFWDDWRDRQFEDVLPALSIGAFGGTGTVTISNGGWLEAWLEEDGDGEDWSVTVGNAFGFGFLGESIYSGNGMLTVTGEGSGLEADGVMVGSADGYGIMEVLDGGYVYCSGMLAAITIGEEFIGRDGIPSGLGRITISGSDSYAESMMFGAFSTVGQAVFQVLDGAGAYGEALLVQTMAFGEGMATASFTVDGEGSAVEATMAQVLADGVAGYGHVSLNITNGGILDLVNFTRQEGGELEILASAEANDDGRPPFEYNPNTATVTVDGEGSLLTAGVINANGEFEAHVFMHIQNDGRVEAEAATFGVNAELWVTDGGVLSLQDTLTIEDGAVLAGDGTIEFGEPVRNGLGGVHVSGRVSPGNGGIGTLTITSAYTQEPGSTLAVDINADGESDKLMVTGPVTLNGGTVQVTPMAGNYGGEKNYLIVQADGGVTGQFEALEVQEQARREGEEDPEDDEDADWGLVYEDFAVWLRIMLGTYSDAALTPNQEAIAKLLEGIARPAAGDLEALLNELDGMTAEELRQALDSISGSEAGDVSQAGLDSANAILGAIFRHLNLFGSGRGGQASRVPALRGNDDSLFAYTAPEDGKWTCWTEAVGAYTRHGSTAANQGYRTHSGGMVVGGDYGLSPSLALGLSLGSSYSSLSWESSAGNTRAESIFTAATMAWKGEDGFYLNGALGLGHSSFESHRNLITGVTATGEHDGLTLMSMLGGGYDYSSGRWAITPNLRLQYAKLFEEGFDEEGGGALNLSYDRTSNDSLRSSLGVALAYTGTMLGGRPVEPEFSLEWMHEFIDDARTVDGSLTSLPGFSFSVRGNDPLGDALVIGAGVTVEASENVSVRLNYHLTEPLDSSDFEIGHSISARVSINF